MIAKTMPVSDLEAIYDAIAELIDSVAEERRNLFLAKLILVLANLVGDSAKVQEALAAARRDV